jgi:Mg-chelatase subunit ChlD
MLGVFLAGVSTVPGRSSDNPQAVFRSVVEERPVYMTVLDSDGAVRQGLSRADFRFLLGDATVEPSVFKEVEARVDLTILVDTSMSMSARVGPVLRSALRQLVQRLDGDDRMAVGSFGVEISVTKPTAPDADRLLTILEEQLWVGGGTPLWQAIGTVVARPRAPDRRCVFLLITDGRDTGVIGSWRGGAERAQNEALAAGCAVSAVTLPGAPRRLADLSNSTGGSSTTVDAIEEVAGLLEHWLARWRHAYLVSFSRPGWPEGERELKVVGPPGLSVRVPSRFGSMSQSLGPVPEAAAARSEGKMPGRPSLIVIMDASDSVVGALQKSGVAGGRPDLLRSFLLQPLTAVMRTTSAAEWSVEARLVGNDAATSVAAGAETASSKIEEWFRSASVAGLGSPMWSEVVAGVRGTAPPGCALAVLSDGMVTGDDVSIAEVESELVRSKCRLYFGLVTAPDGIGAATRYIDSTANPFILLHPYDQSQYRRRLEGLCRASKGAFRLIVRPADVTALLNEAMGAPVLLPLDRLDRMLAQEELTAPRWIP